MSRHHFAVLNGLSPPLNRFLGAAPVLNIKLAVYLAGWNAIEHEFCLERCEQSLFLDGPSSFAPGHVNLVIGKLHVGTTNVDTDTNLGGKTFSAETTLERGGGRGDSPDYFRTNTVATARCLGCGSYPRLNIQISQCVGKRSP
jgi:hypothetical protein